MIRKKLCDINWIKQQKALNNDYSKTITLVDLYCGCGGLTLGALEACIKNKISLDIRLAIDSSKEAINVYRDNFNQYSSDNISSNDINDFFSSNIGMALNDLEKKTLTKIKNVDLLVAGPPCQGHSDLNNKTRRNDPRNLLYLNSARAIELLEPKVFIIENVPNVIHDKNNVVQRTIENLRLKNYFISDLKINMDQIGIAQKRKRHLLIGIKNSNIKLADSFIQYNESASISHYLSDLVDEYLNDNSMFCTPSQMSSTNKERVQYLFNNDLFDLPDTHRPSCHKNKKHSYNSVYGRLHWDKPSQTITSGFGSMGQGRYIHPLRQRVITPHEASRLQGFPDFFSFNSIKTRLELHKVIANAVPPKVSAIIVNELIRNNIL